MAVLAFDGVVLGDLATACEIFGLARDANGRLLYEVGVCGIAPTVRSPHVSLGVPWRLSWLSGADTVLVPGVSDLHTPISDAIVRAIRRAADRGARVASICTGAFVLAATGLLDGRSATTHWLAAAELARRYPAINVDADVLYVDNGDVLTSAGAAAGHDLCLHIIRRDFGADVAARSARVAVMPLERAGGQAQFIVHAPPSQDGSLGAVFNWMEKHLHENLTLARLARQAAMSTRTLSRRFREQAGTTPALWVARARVRFAQRLLETTGASIEQVAVEAGFGSAAVMRERFQQTVGTSPRAYRQSFRRA